MDLQNLCQVFVTIHVVLLPVFCSPLPLSFLAPELIASDVRIPAPAPALQYGDPSCGGRQVIVQLFHWKWTSVATECEDFLGPWGFCGVQVSVPTEHVVVSSPPSPWWQHYQPVSYKLESRFGTEQEFTDMVARCNARGVRIFADVALNNMAQRHLSGVGYNGTSFNTDTLHFPGVPFDKDDFNDPGLKCPSDDGLVHDVTNPEEVRNCSYEGLTDLDQSRQQVQGAIVTFLNRLIDIGVNGFRIDKATFMWPEDLAAIQRKVKDRVSGGRPFYILHVQDLGKGEVTAEQYEDLGYVTEFRYRQLVAEAMLNNFHKLLDVTSLSPAAKLVPSAHALVFLDNHETQRQSSRPSLTFRDGSSYTLATAFMLASDYGFVRLMSGYAFDDVNTGPPANPDGSIQDVVISDNGSCEGGWVCEHRWPTIAMLVEFRTAVAGTDINHWQDDHNFVAFSRGSAGFFAMTSAASCVTKVMTGLPPGTYCELVSECLSTLMVEEEGYVNLNLSAATNPIVAILAGMKVEVSTSVSVDHNNINATFDTSHLTSFSPGVTGYRGSTQHLSISDSAGVQGSTQQHASISDKTGLQNSTQQYAYDTTGFPLVTEQHFSTLERTEFQITSEQQVSALRTTELQKVTDQQMSALNTTEIYIVPEQSVMSTLSTSELQAITEQYTSAPDTFSKLTDKNHVFPLDTTGFQIVTGEPAGDTTGFQIVTGEPAINATGLQIVTGEPAGDTTGFQVVTGEPALNGTGLQIVTGEHAGDTTGFQVVTGEPALNTTGLQIVTGEPPGNTTGFPVVTGDPALNTTGLQIVTGESSGNTTGFQVVTGEPALNTTGLQIVTGKPAGNTTGFQVITGEPAINATGLLIVTGEPAGDTTGFQVVTGEPALNGTGLQIVTGESAGNTTGFQVVTGEPALNTTGLQIVTGEPAGNTTGFQVVTGEPTLDMTGSEVVTDESTTHTTELQVMTDEPGSQVTGLKGTDGQPGSIASSFGLQTFTEDFRSTSMATELPTNVFTWIPSTNVSLVSTEGRSPVSAEPPSLATTPASTMPSLSSYRRTVILLHWITHPGQYVFFRGGIDTEHKPGCVSNAKVDPCAIPIRDRAEGVDQFFQEYNAWRLGDDFLDWYGAEKGQGTYRGQAAEGSPGIWTSSNAAVAGHQLLNTYGDHYWMLDIDMDCSKTLKDGYFELKAYSGHWEPSISTHTCAGFYPPTPYISSNHFARCGYLNVFKEGGSCEVKLLTP